MEGAGPPVRGALGARGGPGEDWEAWRRPGEIGRGPEESGGDGETLVR